MEPWVIVALGGILPFGSIFIEMYFIFTSFWAYKIYYVYGFMLLGKSLGDRFHLLIGFFSVPDPPDCDGLRDHCMYLLPTQCRGLQVSLRFKRIEGCMERELTIFFLYPHVEEGT